VLRKIFGHKRDVATSEWRRLHRGASCSALLIDHLSVHIKRNAMGVTWDVWEIVELLTGFWQGDGRERDHLKDIGIDGSITLK
jgi:hypothetical protein